MRDWLRSLNKKVKTGIGANILRVQWRWPVSRPLVGSFGRGLYEVRTSLDGNIYRVFFCIMYGTMVLLHGFAKKTEATPAKELEIARERQQEVRA